MTTSTGGGTLREFWQFYRRYVETPIHALSVAALAMFGILVFVDSLFALLAIASYVVPPIVLFSIGWSTPAKRDFEPDERSANRARRSDPQSAERGTATTRSNPPARASVRDGDADSDSDDGDSDSDSDGSDSDSDSDGTDTDSDSDGTDTDSDSDS
ncbi:hypothetical protein Halru_1329 [Halovivax ruber XH-70]|uniref:Uncharacterized protein n=1 Tax=Halovivax ruber (strain DSM 18193 / JCM 13892 / XH-70) TaxID=797302 RepID=L0IDA3_HALRX|nr:hypothetical protein Halru_1329 [Halovivax ruber XH-70]